jgi:hypothetical protein
MWLRNMPSFCRQPLRRQTPNRFIAPEKYPADFQKGLPSGEPLSNQSRFQAGGSPQPRLNRPRWPAKLASTFTKQDADREEAIAVVCSQVAGSYDLIIASRI